VSFRARLTLVAAAAVALAIVIASVVVYFVVRDELRAQVDDALAERADVLAEVPPHESHKIFTSPKGELGAAAGYPQIVTDDGERLRPPGETASLPVTEEVLEVARGDRDKFFDDARVEGTHVRYITVPYAPAFALQLARPLTEVDESVDRIRTLLLLIGLGGIAAAAALGLIVSRAALAPVRRLTETTERVTETKDLSERIDAGGRDELSRLAGSFNTMLGALEESTRAQQQLVTDASHELRTPLTSLRTNARVLRRLDRLDPRSRERLLADVEGETRELSHLVEELITLALARGTDEEEDDVQLAAVVRAAAERTRRRTGRVIGIDSDDTRVRGRRQALERAVGNLLENAAKFDTGGTGPIDIWVRRGTITVSDRGPGLAAGDVHRVFDRFYRADAARSLPGSGLGLAIVADIAQAHDGTAFARNRPGGGATIGIEIGASRLLPDSDSRHDHGSPVPETVVWS
jgi:two-component system, OmpR family, sensor histidine kinase MprB